MPKYALVNPFLHGNVKPIFEGKNQLEAANNAYQEISKYFSSNQPEFIFTIQYLEKKKNLAGGNSSDYYTFKVDEKRNIKNNNEIKFNLQEINFNKEENKGLNVFKKELKNTINNIKSQNKEKKGGNIFSDNIFDSDDEVDDDDNYLYNIYDYPRMRYSTPIYGYYYWPSLYNRFYTSNFFYIPTFSIKSTPYIYISNKETIPKVTISKKK